MSKLVLLGGPPGVGKSTVLNCLRQRLPRAALVDADDVWQASRESVTDANREAAQANVISVMSDYFATGAELGVLSWVFARPELYDPVIEGLEDFVESVQQIYLVASPDVLAQRLSDRRSDKGEEAAILGYSLGRLELINALPFAKIDTSTSSPNEVAEEILQLV